MIRTESDIRECRKLWEMFSPRKEAWDDWELMFAYHDEDRHRLNFLVHHAGDSRPDGLVPLVYDTVEDRYMLMGGSYPDGRTLWLQSEDFPEFFDAFPERTVFFDLKASRVEELVEPHPQLAGNFGEPDLRYYVKPSECGFDFDNHFEAFPPDKKRKFVYDLRNIRKRDPALTWGRDDEAELFIQLVNRNFGALSDYADEANANEVRRVIGTLARNGHLKTLTIALDGAPQAVSLSAIYGNRMVALYASSNSDYNNLGKLLNFETIQEACRLRLDEISLMTGMKWKADWKLSGEPCLTMRKPPAPWPEATGSP